LFPIETWDANYESEIINTKEEKNTHKKQKEIRKGTSDKNQENLKLIQKILKA